MAEPVPLREMPVAVTVRLVPTLLWLKFAAVALQVIPDGLGLSTHPVIVAVVVPS